MRMDFLKECARRLDDGESASAVLDDMRQRYTTIRCLNVKAGLVRQMCRPTDEYVRACECVVSEALEARGEAFARLVHEAIVQYGKHRKWRLLNLDCGDEEERRVCRDGDGDGGSATEAGTLRREGIQEKVEEELRECWTRDDEREVWALLRTLPPRLSANARALCVSRTEGRECKRLSARGLVEKNKARIRVDGRALLAHARRVVAAEARDHNEGAREGEGAKSSSSSSSSSHSIAELALCLMLLTGRRTCEVLNGASHFSRLLVDSEEEEGDEYALIFKGQAKRRGMPSPAYRIPVLAPPAILLSAMDALRARQGGWVAETNRACSLRYQSLLARTLGDDSKTPWKACGRVHALRGIYAVLCLRLFDWTLPDGEEPTDAYVTMHILGHASVEESLAYTAYSVGPGIVEEPPLGRGRLTPRTTS